MSTILHMPKHFVFRISHAIILMFIFIIRRLNKKVNGSYCYRFTSTFSQNILLPREKTFPVRSD